MITLGMTVLVPASHSGVNAPSPTARRTLLMAPKLGSNSMAQSRPLMASEMITGMK